MAHLSIRIWKSRYLRSWSNILVQLLLLSRPFQLAKAVAIVVWAQYCGLANHLPTGASFVGVIGVTLLTAGFYSMNDLADQRIDRISSLKKLRPLAANKVSVTVVKVWTTACITLGLAVLFIKSYLLVCLGAGLLFNAWAYSMPPLRLKEHPVLDVLSGALISQTGRYTIGHYSVTALALPIYPLLGALFFKVSTYLLYRKAGQIQGCDPTPGSHTLVNVNAIALVTLLLTFGASWTTS